MNGVKKILGYYAGEPPDVVKNLARMLNHGALKGSGKLVILPVDQGFEHGPLASFAVNPPAYNPLYHFQFAMQAGVSAYAAPYGFLAMGAKKYAKKIPLILKVNNSSRLYKNTAAPMPALTASVEQALSLGCSAIGFTIYPGSDAAHKMYEQVAKLGEQARRFGLALVIWAYPRGRGVSRQGETALDIVAYAAHIAAELGAHIIKVKPPADKIEDSKIKSLLKKQNISTKKLSDRVKVVLQSAFHGRRIVIFSGGAFAQKKSFLQEVNELAKGGAFGSIVGRNAFQRPKPKALKLLKEIMQIYKNQSIKTM